MMNTSLPHHNTRHQHKKRGGAKMLSIDEFYSLEPCNTFVRWEHLCPQYAYGLGARVPMSMYWWDMESRPRQKTEPASSLNISNENLMKDGLSPHNHH
mmetsp:Transcript_32709/g.53045  ORF Transcript_32709/g.53045 Transcript_32709/m.53045 type:complete len:98 (+) Transcript_32709:101-394(+)